MKNYFGLNEKHLTWYGWGPFVLRDYSESKDDYGQYFEEGWIITEQEKPIIRGR